MDLATLDDVLFSDKQKIVAVFLAWVLFLSVVTTSFGGLVGVDMATVHIWLTNSWFMGIVPFSVRIFPPSYHITVALLSRLTFTTPTNMYLFLQMFLYAGIFYTTYLLVKSQFRGNNLAAFVVFLMATSVAFWDRGLSPASQAFDMLLAPLMILTYLEDRKTLFSLLAIYTFYGHAIYAVPPILAIFVYDIWFNDHKYLSIFILLFVTFLPLTWLFLSSGQLLGHDIPASIDKGNNPQELAFLKSPAQFSFKYLGTPLVLLFIVAVYFGLNYKMDGYTRGFAPNFRLFKVSFCWILALFMLYFWFPDRFLEYLVQPLSIMIAIWLPDKVRVYLFYPLAIWAFTVQTTLFIALLAYGTVPI